MLKFYKLFKSLASKHRSFQANLILGHFLVLTAGAINAGGFFIFQQYTSHMTGILSLAADSLASEDWRIAVFLLSYILQFIVGASVTTLIVLKARKHCLYSQYALPLLLEALMLICLFWLMMKYEIDQIPIPIIISAVCFLMGVQNALITKISKAVIRTTHVTGMATDLGIGIGRILFERKNRRQEKIFAKVHTSLITSFLIGGIIGAFGFKYFGISTMYPMAVIIIIITLPHIIADFRFYVRYKSFKSRKLNYK